MFDKFKQAKQLKDIRNTLAKEKEICEKEGVKVVVNGQMKVEEIEIGSEIGIDKAQVLVKECTNEAFKKIQKKAAKKMQEIGGF